jgi:hypothetical protein
MTKGIQQKMAQYKRMANSRSGNSVSTTSRSTSNDSLSKVIRSKKDGEDFMSEVESAFQRAK